MSDVEIGSTIDRVSRCWGKTGPAGSTASLFHPAMYHMLDVGNVARILLEPRASSRWCRVMAHAMSADQSTLVDSLPYVVSMHDIGKVSIAFQSKSQDQVGRLRTEGFAVTTQSPVLDLPHAIISQAILNPQTGTLKMAGCPRFTRAWSEAMGGHHGRFVAQDTLKRARVYLLGESVEWDALRKISDAALREALLKTDAVVEPANISAAIMALTGFTVLCDWIGSDARYFLPTSDIGWTDYIILSRERAEMALRSNGFLTRTASAVPTGVATLFNDLGTLRPLQQVMDEIPDALLEGPILAIIEAPTGEGKTEAALALARRIASITGTDELFYALPTMATSNQMFGRLRLHLNQRLALDAEVKLVHGQAFLVEEDLRADSPLSGIESLRNGDKESQGDPLEWFSGKKRALLAPFGVGTVDQAELAALNAKHAALRMIGLAGKVVIVDEVHAYDVYMTTVIARLLQWLATMNTSVILLSATLPKSRRAQLIAAYSGLDISRAIRLTDEYPSMTIVRPDDSKAFAATVWQPSHQISVWQPNRTIELGALHFGDQDSSAKARWLMDAVREGGCACWITNTVRRAQDIFEELVKLKSNARSDVLLDMLHSQLPLEDRQRQEAALTEIYGRDGAKTGKRPMECGGIVVGTQVLEQSLDLDFDVMVSDLAPVDLLLQRAGRLHRHERTRPSGHESPRLYLNYEENVNSDLQITSDATVYAEYVQRQTHRILLERALITLPDDYRKLVEGVYGDVPPSEEDPLRSAWNKFENEAAQAAFEAQLRLLPRPGVHDSFAATAANKVRFEESEARADWLVAKTRLGEETLNVIPLEREGKLACLPDGTIVDLNVPASRATQLRLLRRHLRINRQAAIEALLQDAMVRPTVLFRESNLLADYVPLWLSGGEATLPHWHGGLTFALHPKLGLRISKERVHDDSE